MKRTLAAGIFTLATGVVSLLLLASIFYSCRTGGDPHHEQSGATFDTPPVENVRSTPPIRRASAEIVVFKRDLSPARG